MADYVYPPVIRTAFAIYRGLDISFQVSGYEHIPATGGAVLASNHISYLDFIFVGTPPWIAQKRLTRFMAKESVFRNNVSGPLMRGMHHIPVDREAGANSMRHAVDALRAGELVGMFPEATISQSFVVKDMKTGAARMAAEAGVPLIPAAVWGTHRLWTKNHPRQLTLRGKTVGLRVGAPMTVSPDDDMREATATLRRRVQALLDEAQAVHPDTKNPPPDAWWLPQHLGGTAPSPKLAAQWDEQERAERATARRKRLAGEN